MGDFITKVEKNMYTLENFGMFGCGDRNNHGGRLIEHL